MIGEPVDAARVARTGIETPEDAWRFIRALFSGFGPPPGTGDGYSDTEIAEARVPVPGTLADLYRRFGRRPELTANQDRLLGPHQIVIHEGVLVIRDENQSAASWGIPADRLGEEDPPVVFEHGDGWRPYLDRVSLAAVEFALTETVLGGDGRDNACELSAKLIRHVRSRYTRIPFPDYVNWAGDDESPIHWFSAPGKLLRLDGPGPWPWLYVRGRTSADLVELCADIDGRWSQEPGPDDRLTDVTPASGRTGAGGLVGESAASGPPRCDGGGGPGPRDEGRAPALAVRTEPPVRGEESTS